MLIKMVVIAAFGVPVLAVLIFEITLNDRRLRLLTVTPDMHRVHHSVLIQETNSNFGFNFPYWDRLFGTYRPQPVRGA